MPTINTRVQPEQLLSLLDSWWDHEDDLVGIEESSHVGFKRLPHPLSADVDKLVCFGQQRWRNHRLWHSDDTRPWDRSRSLISCVTPFSGISEPGSHQLCC